MFLRQNLTPETFTRADPNEQKGEASGLRCHNLVCRSRRNIFPGWLGRQTPRTTRVNQTGLSSGKTSMEKYETNQKEACAGKQT